MPKLTTEDASLTAHFPEAGVKSLASVRVIHKVLADLAKDVLDIHHEFRAGRPGGKNPVERITERANDAAMIFTGRDDEYELPDWMRPARMNGMLRQLADERNQKAHPEFEDGALAFFTYFCEVVVAHATALDEKSVPAAEVDAALKKFVEDVADRIIGVKAQPA